MTITIQFFDLPIGVLPEEALEAIHTGIRHNRLYHTRKNSEEDGNKDLLNILLLTSLTSGKRKSKAKNINRGKITGIESYLLFVCDGETIELIESVSRQDSD